MNTNRHTGFTLAEVLITLGIIGVVAALTIPALIQNSQKQEYVTKLKKAYSTINQALVQMANDNGCPGDLKCTGIFSASNDNTAVGAIFTKYFKVAKDCGVQHGAGCFSATTNGNYDGTGGTYYQDDTDHYKFITSDGMSISFDSSLTNCGNSTYSTGATGNLTQECAFAFIDVNGPAGPNRSGRDFFEFWITNGKGPLLYPRCGIDDNNFGTGSCWWNLAGRDWCSSNSTAGPFCPGRVIEKGWIMDY